MGGYGGCSAARQNRSTPSWRGGDDDLHRARSCTDALGECLEFFDEADPGDFIYVPPYVPHQEINAHPDIPCEAVIVRSGQDPVVVNLDIESPEP